MTLGSPLMLRSPDVILWRSHARQAWIRLQNSAKARGAQDMAHKIRPAARRGAGSRLLRDGTKDGASALPRSVRTISATRACDRLVHDISNGTRAPAALWAAAEATINLPGGAGYPLIGERRAHVMVAKHVAGTDNHGDRTLLH
jgi:hypothetical protein